MKNTYIYFGTKGYVNTPGVAPSSNVAALATTTIANSGLLTVTKANTVVPNTLPYRVVIVGGDQVDNVRGTDYTNDFVTGALFNVDGDDDINQDDKFVGQATELTSAKAFISGNGNGVITIGDNTATGGTVGSDAASGFTMTTADTVIIEQTKRADEGGNGPTAGSTLSVACCYPMSSFVGANPIAYGKTHYDGTVLDQTNLHFVKRDGTSATDEIILIHKAGKYPEIVKAMEAIKNSGVYNRAITFYDLDVDGNETFIGGASLSGNNDLGIVGCFRKA